MNTRADDDEHFVHADNGIFVPKRKVQHRDDVYDPAGFESLREMQTRHFWYRGRHRFLLNALETMLRRHMPSRVDELSILDLGGGCGGWISYLRTRSRYAGCELALADSSLRALEYAADFVGPSVKRFQVDLLQLPWKARWDVVFLLDVLEYLHDDADVIRQICTSLRPGGLLFVTTPALRFFWTYNDDLAHHLRRYSRKDFAALAGSAGCELCWSRYFMFLLSPLLYFTRIRPPDVENMDAEELRALLKRTHRVPAAPANAILTAVFSLETPIGVWLPFPWGTSIIGVFKQKN